MDGRKLVLILMLMLSPLMILGQTQNEQLIQALMESNQLLEESKITISELQMRVDNFLIQVSDYQTQVQNYQTLVENYPVLFLDLKTSFQETKTSYEEYKVAVNNQIEFQKDEISRFKFLSYVSIGGLAGLSVGSLIQQEIPGLGIGLGLGLITFGIDYLITRF